VDCVERKPKRDEELGLNCRMCLTESVVLLGDCSERPLTPTTSCGNLASIYYGTWLPFHNELPLLSVS
jgi:hypothetical protein